MKVVSATAVLVSIFLLGCASLGNSPVDIAKSSSQIQAFIQEHPNAKISTVYLTEDKAQAKLSAYPECQDVQPQAMYFISFDEPQTHAIAFVDVQTQLVLCSVVQNPAGSTPTGTPAIVATNSPNPYVSVAPSPELPTPSSGKPVQTLRPDTPTTVKIGNSISTPNGFHIQVAEITKEYPGFEGGEMAVFQTVYPDGRFYQENVLQCGGGGVNDYFELWLDRCTFSEQPGDRSVEIRVKVLKNGPKADEPLRNVNVAIVTDSPDSNFTLGIRAEFLPGLRLNVTAIQPKLVQSGTLDAYELIILQDAPICDLATRMTVADRVKAGGKLLIIGDACTRVIDDPYVIGWDVGIGALGDIVPATYVGPLNGETNEESEGIFRPADDSHSIYTLFPDEYMAINGISKYLFQGHVTEVRPKANAKVLAYIESTGGRLAAEDTIGIVENQDEAGKTIYVAFNPYINSALKRNALMYLVAR